MNYSSQPPLWNLVFEKTDNTEFLILSLIHVLKFNEDISYSKIKQLNKTGSCIIGTYTRDVAESIFEKLNFFSRLENQKIQLKLQKKLNLQH